MVQSEQVNSSIIVNELQLGQSLNKAVSSGDSAKFAYLLSMLSDDVLDQPQFQFACFDRIKPAPDETQLRKEFSLPESAPLFSDAETMLRATNQSQLFAEGGSITDVRLLAALAPTALVAKKEDDNSLPADILDILPHWKRADVCPKPEYSSSEPMIELLNKLHSSSQTAL
ncbi:hypothetical protein DU002_02370 [Corallincola holothuriorum]|uniref:QueD like 2 n=1 Tax=Corallincola holothuriorum TaxID=2282215 RepID=A0A368NQZ7_9GAMM|nr:hypothetical protein DU002_02370 [Corallincola holothuriorum]